MAPPVPPQQPHHPGRHDPDKPDTCNTAYDAVAVIRREVFVFKGRVSCYASPPSIATLARSYQIRTSQRVLIEVRFRLDWIIEFVCLQYLWRIGDHGLSPGYPAEIDRLWYGLPKNFTHVDAVYERIDKKIVFFIGM